MRPTACRSPTRRCSTRSMIEIGEDFGLRGDLLFIFGLSHRSPPLASGLCSSTGRKLGMATRAVAQQPVAAQLCGMSSSAAHKRHHLHHRRRDGRAGRRHDRRLGRHAVAAADLADHREGPDRDRDRRAWEHIPGAIIAGLMVGMPPRTCSWSMRGVTERDMYVMLLLFIFLAFRPYGGMFGSSRARATRRDGQGAWISGSAWHAAHRRPHHSRPVRLYRSC